MGIVMGRHAGFLTASSALLKKKNSDGPHLIFIPEEPFNYNNFLNQIKKNYNKYGRCIIAISEGIQDSKKNLISKKINKNNEYDAHGNIQLSGTGLLGDYLSQHIKKKLKIDRVRADTLGYAQRSFQGAESEIDQEEAYKIGLQAVKLTLNNTDSFSVGLAERENYKTPYKISIIKNKLSDVAGKTKIMKKNFYNKKENFVTKDFINYSSPLIGKKIRKTFSIF